MNPHSECAPVVVAVSVTILAQSACNLDFKHLRLWQSSWLTRPDDCTSGLVVVSSVTVMTGTIEHSVDAAALRSAHPDVSVLTWLGVTRRNLTRSLSLLDFWYRYANSCEALNSYSAAWYSISYTFRATILVN